MRKGIVSDAGIRSNSPYLNFSGNSVLDTMFKQAGLPAPSSAYAFNVKNNFALNVPNLVLFGANSILYGGSLGSGFFLNGMYSFSTVQVDGIYGIYNYYQILLAQSQTQPFTIGTVVISAVSVNAQLQQTIQVSTTDANGQTVGSPMVLLKDPYQKQRDMIVYNTPFSIDGTTSLTIQNVLPSAEFNIYLFPSDNVNPINILSGKNTMEKYASPNVIRVHPAPVAKK